MRSPLSINVKAEVPKKSAGRFLDAITDLFRPFSESRGLRADMIRLQREDVLLKIGRKARARLELEAQPIRPIPLKGLVPLLERASLESPQDHVMINLWANLLASSAIREQPNLPRYVTILSEINGAQARILER